MQDAILRHLRDVEREFGVKVLLAVESGSRAWGFSSADSDWDVRFIYVHPADWYLSVEEGRDVIEKMYEDDVDLAGWDLRKAMQLFARGNPSLFEWFHSPVVYYRDDAFLSRILAMAQDFFNPVHTMYHYQHIYVKHDERYLERDGAQLKRFLYYLRGVLACRWIDLHGSLPPVAFAELTEAVVPEEDMRKEIFDLLELKRMSKEYDKEIVPPELFGYAKTMADYYSAHVGEYRPENLRTDRRKELDCLLYDMVMGYDGLCGVDIFSSAQKDFAAGAYICGGN